MKPSNRFPSSYSFLAALAGAVAWCAPYLMLPFIRILPFIPRFPTYKSPPYSIYLTDLTISYAAAGIFASSLFLIGLRVLPINRERYSRPALSFTIVLAALVGMAIGGAFASVFGFGIGFSQPGYSMMYSLGVLDKALNTGPEPFLSIGLVIGTALAAIIICSFSGILKPFALSKNSPTRITLEIALKASGMAIIGRLLVYTIEFSSFATYTTFGQSILFLFLVFIAGGALFGALTWIFCSSLKLTEPR